jgi:hypothetical protein
MMTQQYNERIVYITENMLDKAETFKEKEYKKKKELIDLTAELQRALYAANLRTGYDATPYNEGNVQHTKLGTVHVEAMKDELEARGIEYAPNDGIWKLTKALQIFTKIGCSRIQAGIQKSMTTTTVRLGFSSQ